MGRYKPGMRSVLLDLILRKMRERGISAASFIALADRAAELDNLYHAPLTRVDRPMRLDGRVKADPAPEIEPETVGDAEADALYKKYLEEQYGGREPERDQSTSPENHKRTG